MAKLLQQIDHVSKHLTETFRNEQALVKSLRDALYDLDQRLLRDIREVAADHQIRRGTILNELQDLAGSIGKFLPQHEDAQLEQVATPQPVVKAQTVTAITEQVDYGYQYSPAAGDWRQATNNLSLQDELEFHLKDLNGKRSKH
jgi:hypothetical protein